MIPKRLAEQRDKLTPNFKNLNRARVVEGIHPDVVSMGVWRTGFDACAKLLLNSAELKGLVEAARKSSNDRADENEGRHIFAVSQKALDQWNAFIAAK